MEGTGRDAGDRPAAVLELSGPMTLAEVPRWREALLAALAEGKDLRVDLAAAGPWDLAGLQLILAALATGRRAGRSIRLVRVPQVFRAIAERAALTDVLAEAIESDEDPARRAERPLSQPVPR